MEDELKKLIGSIPFGSVRRGRRIFVGDSIPFGSLRPDLSTIRPGDEQLTVPYGSLKPTPLAPSQPPSQSSQQTPPPLPPTDKK